MDGMLFAQVGALILFLTVVLALHELAHVAVARAYGYPVLCLGVSPLAIGVAFLDQPLRRYWLLQVLVPLVVTAAATYLGMSVVPILAPAAQFVFSGSVLWQLGFSLLLSALTSSGDMASMGMELRKPLWGRDRVVRDVRLLKRLGSFLWFTSYGKRYLSGEFGLSTQEFVQVATGQLAMGDVRQRT